MRYSVLIRLPMDEIQCIDKITNGMDEMTNRWDIVYWWDNQWIRWQMDERLFIDKMNNGWDDQWMK